MVIASSVIEEGNEESESESEQVYNLFNGNKANRSKIRMIFSVINKGYYPSC